MSGAQSPSPRWRRVAPALVALLALAANLPALEAGPVLDDHGVVLDNPLVQGPLDPRAIFGSNVFGDRPGFAHAAGYRPLTVLSFRLGDPSDLPWQRGINLLLHALVSCLVLGLALALGAGRWVALGAAALFAVHPVHVDAIVPLNNRSELLCGALLLGAALLWWRAKGPAAGLLAVLLGALSALAKEQGVVAPVILALPVLAAARATLKGRDPRQAAPAPARWRWALLVLSLAFALGAVALRASALGHALGGSISPSDNPLVEAEGPSRILGPGRVVMVALRLLLWPVALSADYTRDALPLPATWLDPAGLLGLGLLALSAVGLLLALWRGRSRLVASFGSALALYGVTSNTLFLTPILFAERLLYIPSAFLAAGLAGAVLRLPRPRSALRGVAPALLVAVTALLAGRSWLQAVAYQGPGSLAEASLAATPGSARMWALLGSVRMGAGDGPAAERAFREALRHDPRSTLALGRLGEMALRAGRFEEASRRLDDALAASRGGAPAVATNACLAHLRAGRPKVAQARCRAALRIDPHNATARIHLARALAAAGRLHEATRLLDSVLAVDPESFLALVHAAQIRLRAGDRAGAERAWRRALRQRPEDPRLRAFGERAGFRP